MQNPNFYPNLNQQHQQQKNDISRTTAAGRRPKLSLASLIGQAILASPGQKARLSTIYEWISNKYPEYYQTNSGGWQNSIRHNLTINKAFVKLQKEENDGPGKGSFWAIDAAHIHEFQDGVFTGRIRGSEYRTQTTRTKKARRQSDASASNQDLLTQGHIERLSQVSDDPFSHQFYDRNNVQYGFYPTLPQMSIIAGASGMISTQQSAVMLTNPQLYGIMPQEHGDLACRCPTCLQAPFANSDYRIADQTEYSSHSSNYYFSTVNTDEEIEYSQLQPQAYKFM